MKKIKIVYIILSIIISLSISLKIKNLEGPLDSVNVLRTNQTIGDSNSTLIKFNISGALVTYENMTVIPYLYGTVNITECQ